MVEDPLQVAVVTQKFIYYVYAPEENLRTRVLFHRWSFQRSLGISYWQPGYKLRGRWSPLLCSCRLHKNSRCK
jgi:hypothetical protein